MNTNTLINIILQPTVEEKVSYVLESDAYESKFWRLWTKNDFDSEFPVDYLLESKWLDKWSNSLLESSARKWRLVLYMVSRGMNEKAVKLAKTPCSLCYNYLCTDCPWVEVRDKNCLILLDNLDTQDSHKTIQVSLQVLETLKEIERKRVIKDEPRHIFLY